MIVKSSSKIIKELEVVDAAVKLVSVHGKFDV